MAIINGADKGVFGVDSPLTREEMAAMLNKARAASKTANGRDITEKEWPGRPSYVSRGLFADAVAQAFGFGSPARRSRRRYAEPSPEPGPQPSKAVLALNSLGILDFYRSERGFHPSRPITRGEAVEILMRAMTAR
jgi:hypothetical protein